MTGDDSVPLSPALAAGRSAVQEVGYGASVGGRLVWNMPKIPSMVSKGVAKLVKHFASETDSRFGMLQYTIQHGGHGRTKRRLKGGLCYISLDLPRCDAQFQSWLTVLLIVATLAASCEALCPGTLLLPKYVFESSTFVAIITCTGHAFLKLFGLSSGHSCR